MAGLIIFYLCKLSLQQVQFMLVSPDAAGYTGVHHAIIYTGMPLITKHFMSAWMVMI